MKAYSKVGTRLCLSAFSACASVLPRLLSPSQAGLTPRRGVFVRSLDVGGAGPVAALLAAKHAVEHGGKRAVAVVAADAPASVPVEQFLSRADAACRPPLGTDCSPVPSPAIPNYYDRIARWHMLRYGTTREQLAMCASLMTYQACKHPSALRRHPRLLEEVLASQHVAPVTSKLECAKLVDGGAALIVTAGDAAAAAQTGSRGASVELLV